MEEMDDALTPFEERSDFNDVRLKVQEIKQQIGQIIVGQDSMVELLIVALLSNGHVLLEGNPGLGKTLTARLMAQSLFCHFGRIQFTPDLMPSDVIGTAIFNMQTSSFEFKKGPIFSNIILIDEINRAPAKTQAALFEVMEERQITVDGHTYLLEDPFMIIATQNPIEMEGTYRLPEAQMDRFFFKIKVDYPSFDEEIGILKIHHMQKSSGNTFTISPVLTPSSLASFKRKLKSVILEDNILHYITKIVQATRHHRDIVIGASPRASIALMTGGKTLGMIRGRDFVIPEDIIDLAIPVLEHRITISPEKEMEGVTPSQIIEYLLQSIEFPR